MVAVEYKYPNENKVIVDKANSYDIETLYSQPVEWQAIGKYDNPFTARTYSFVSNPVPSPSGTIVEQFASDPNGLITRADWYLQSSIGELVILSQMESRIFTSASQFMTLTGIQIGIEAVAQGLRLTHWSFNVLSSNSPVKVYLAENLQILFWWISKLGTKYKLKIFENGQLVFSRTEPYRPEYVKLIGAECPPNTCPVLCGNGNHVCCYGTNGIATDSFLFSESVYQ